MTEILDQGYLALPSTTDRVAVVMVIPAWWGLNAFFKQLCDRLAQSGFVAFAPDLFAGKVAETIEQAMALRGELDSTAADKLVHDCVEALRNHPRTNGQPIGLVGFSLGAFHALSLLRESPDQVGALVIFYGTYPDTYPNTQAAVLGHFAETDDYEPLDDQQAMEKALKAAGIEVTFHTYPGTGHWFFEANQPTAYDPDAAELAWERTIHFLKEQL